MFIDPSPTSRLAPFEGAKDNQTFNHLRIILLLRTESDRCCAAFYRHLTPNRGESFVALSNCFWVLFQILQTRGHRLENARVAQNENERSK